MSPENSANFKSIIAALSEAAGETLALEDGKVLFALDDSLGVSIVPVDEEEAGEDAALVSIVIGQAPTDEEFLTFLLEQNYLGVGSGGGYFAIDRGTGTLVLCRTFPLPLEAAEFVDAFGSLAGAARAALARLGVATTPEDTHFLGMFFA